MRWPVFFLAVMLCAFGWLPAARAQVFGISELRGGVVLSGPDATAPMSGFGLLNGTAVADANVELLFDNPMLDILSFFGTLRPHVGVNANFTGSRSAFYGGLSWTYVVLDTPVFVEASLGGMVDSAVLPNAATAPTDFACSVALRATASAGYAITSNFSVLGTYEHFQRAGTCGTGPSPPDDRIAFRLGVHF